MATLEATVKTEGDLTTLSLAGTLDINTAPTLEPKSDEILASKPPRVEADLAGLELIDSAGVAALVKLYKGVKRTGGSFKVVHARDQPMAIFKLLRMDKVFL